MDSWLLGWGFKNGRRSYQVIIDGISFELVAYPARETRKEMCIKRDLNIKADSEKFEKSCLAIEEIAKALQEIPDILYIKDVYKGEGKITLEVLGKALPSENALQSFIQGIFFSMKKRMPVFPGDVDAAFEKVAEVMNRMAIEFNLGPSSAHNLSSNTNFNLGPNTLPSLVGAWSLKPSFGSKLGEEERKKERRRFRHKAIQDIRDIFRHDIPHIAVAPGQENDVRTNLTISLMQYFLSDGKNGLPKPEPLSQWDNEGGNRREKNSVLDPKITKLQQDLEAVLNKDVTLEKRILTIAILYFEYQKEKGLGERFR